MTDTATRLYATDTVFRVLVDLWVQEKRCPLILVDRCLDFGLEAAADCARWAATEPDRDVWADRGTPRAASCGPYPIGGVEIGYYWCRTQRGIEHANEVPYHNATTNATAHSLKDHPAPARELILWLLDNWQPSKDQS